MFQLVILKSVAFLVGWGWEDLQFRARWWDPGQGTGVPEGAEHLGRLTTLNPTHSEAYPPQIENSRATAKDPACRNEDQTEPHK